MAQKRKKRNPLTLDELRCSMSTALTELESIFMDTGNDADLRVKAINSLATLANAYTRITEATDLENRIEALENTKMRAVS